MEPRESITADRLITILLSINVVQANITSLCYSTQSLFPWMSVGYNAFNRGTGNKSVKLLCLRKENTESLYWL